MFTMTGTTGSAFDGVLALKAGKLGFRDLGNGQFRVRVEPNNGTTLSFGSGWKTPGYVASEKRYSTVVNGVAALAETIATASKVLAAASIVEVPAVPEVYIPAVPAHIEIQ